MLFFAGLPNFNMSEMCYWSVRMLPAYPKYPQAPEIPICDKNNGS